MSDVREQLFEAINNVNSEWAYPSTIQRTVAAILERFDVTPKPVISDDDLGSMVSKAAGGHSGSSIAVGRKMLDQLDAACLKIVRVDE
jgi:hypothetical protein